MIWAPSDALICCLAHIAAGYAFIMTGAYFKHIKLAFLLLIIWSILKEFIFDIIVEEQTIQSGWHDTTAYLIGALLAFGIIYLKKHLHGPSF
jgi:hypothetical protein